MNLQISTEITSAVRRWKPYPAYKESGVAWLGQAPAGWQILRLKQVARLMYGDSLPVESREDGSVPVYGSNGIVGYHSRANASAPVLIIGRKGSYGKINFTNTPSYAIDTTYYVDKRTSEADLRWLYYAMIELGLDAYSEDSAIPGLSRDYVYSRVLPVPSIGEQQAIASFLDGETAKIDALVTKKERLIGLLQEKRAALITRAVTKGLDPNVPMKDFGFEWLGEIPAHWDKKPAKAVCERIIDCKNRTPEYDKDGEYPVVRTTDVRDGKLALAQCFRTDEKNFRAWTLRGAPQRDDILFTREAPAGEAALYDGTQRICLGQRMMYFRVDPETLVPRFLLYSIYGSLVKGYVLAGSGGSTVTHLRLGQVYNLPLLIPPLSEQCAIVSYLDAHTTIIDRMVAKVREGIECLQEYRTALITAAVTGKIDVREEISSRMADSPEANATGTE